jgi:hypothetical protein
MKKQLYRLEMFSVKDNCWVVVKNNFRNEINATINGEVLNKSRKCHCRVIHKGQIIWEVK